MTLPQPVKEGSGISAPVAVSEPVAPPGKEFSYRLVRALRSLSLAGLYVLGVGIAAIFICLPFEYMLRVQILSAACMCGVWLSGAGLVLSICFSIIYMVAALFVCERFSLGELLFGIFAFGAALGLLLGGYFLPGGATGVCLWGLALARVVSRDPTF